MIYFSVSYCNVITCLSVAISFYHLKYGVCGSSSSFLDFPPSPFVFSSIIFLLRSARWLTQFLLNYSVSTLENTTNKELSGRLTKTHLSQERFDILIPGVILVMGSAINESIKYDNFTSFGNEILIHGIHTSWLNLFLILLCLQHSLFLARIIVIKYMTSFSLHAIQTWLIVSLKYNGCLELV